MRTPSGVQSTELRVADFHHSAAYGGSTIVAVFPAGRVQWDADLVANSQVPLETAVRVRGRVIFIVRLTDVPSLRSERESVASCRSHAQDSLDLTLGAGCEGLYDVGNLSPAPRIARRPLFSPLPTNGQQVKLRARVTAKAIATELGGASAVECNLDSSAASSSQTISSRDKLDDCR